MNRRHFLTTVAAFAAAPMCPLVDERSVFHGLHNDPAPMRVRYYEAKDVKVTWVGPDGDVLFEGPASGDWASFAFPEGDIHGYTMGGHVATVTVKGGPS